MAKKIMTLEYTQDELEKDLKRLHGDEPLFIIVVDDKEKCKRIFRNTEDAQKWFAERDSEDGLSPETRALEFANIDGNGTIPGTEQYELRVSVPARTYSLQGDTDIYLEFDFATVDKSTNSVVGNPVDVFYSINNSSGLRQKSKVYDYEEGKRYRFKLDEYLALGNNTITMMVRDRALGISRMVSTTHEVINFTLDTSFNIAQPLTKPTDSLSVAYECRGSYKRIVHFYIDGKEVSTETLAATESGANLVKTFTNFGNTYGLGTHALQLKASMSLDDENARIFWTPLIYCEFEVAGMEHTTTLVRAIFPSSQDPFNGELPGFEGKQFEKQGLDWAYYSSDNPKANVLWRLLNASGEETTIGSRTADVVEGEAGVLPEPVTFMPTEAGVFQLQALVGGVVVKSYKITVAPNEEISEATNDMKVRLTSIGRSNSEEPEFRKDWSSIKNGVRAWCDFSEGFPFTAAAGYNNGGVEFYNGYTGIIRGYKPFAPENASVVRNGICFGMRFRTFNMDDEDALVAHIGDPSDNKAGVFIYPNKAILRSSAGRERDIEVRFKDEEDVDLYWIVYPNHDQTMELFTFLQVNGIRCFPRIYDIAENYNIGSTESGNDYGLLHLGDPNGRCGLRVYSIRMYGIYQDERQLCNNFIIDSGEDLEKQIDHNDIYQMGGGMLDVDVNKLKERMPVITFIGDIPQMEGGEGKPELSNVGFELAHNEYDTHYAKCDLAHLKKSGQSTQDRLGPPSMHIKFNKNKSNVLYDRDGKAYPKNRMPILPGYTPENSLRILNNTLDSSNCHTGGALSFINQIARDTSIDGQHPLRTPAMDYVLSGKYSEAMAQRHKNISSDPEHWKFPYELSFTPHAYPGAVVYKKDKDSPVVWLGLYTFIEEKKSFYANGGHSIYDAIDEDGNPDPYCLKSSKSNWNVLYDNTGFLRFEIVTKSKYAMLQKGGETTFDTDKAGREASIEKVSEHDNETEADIAMDWTEYGNEIVKRLCPTEGNQAAFDAIVWNIFNIYNVCAYYAWMIILCNTDGSFRNINHVRYQTGKKWNLVPWDWDMILGLLQDTYRLDAQPTSELYAKVDGTYIFNGMGDRTEGATGQDSYWFWDAVLKNAEFKAMLPRMLAAMYSAGMNKNNWFKTFDRFTDTFSPALYNVDAQGKYIKPNFEYKKNYLVSDQGDRKAHRHWFLDTNVDFMEQQYGVGDFANNRTSTRAADAENCKVYAKAGATAFFGWTISGEEADPESSRTPRMAMGEEFSMTVNRKLTSKDILGILSPHKLEGLDMHEFAPYFSADLQFNACFNEVTGVSLMKKLNLGMTDEQIRSMGANQRAVNTIDGINQMARLEWFSCRGQRGLKSNPVITDCHNLKEYYAGASGLTAFNPPSGASFNVVELNDVVGSFLAVDVAFPESGIKFLSETLEEVDCPTSLLVLNLTGMGDDKGTHNLLHRWLTMLKNHEELLPSAQLTCTNIDWVGLTKSDLLTLARIPKAQRRVNGYVMITDSAFTDEEMNYLQREDIFGNGVFSYSNISTTLVCDNSQMQGMMITAVGEKTSVLEDGTIEVLQGTNAVLSAVGFPIKGSDDTRPQWYDMTNATDVVPPTTGNEDAPYIMFGVETQIHYKTGELLTIECEEPTHTYKVHCSSASGGSGDAILKVVARSYPTSAEILKRNATASVSESGGVLNVISNGAITFDAKHLPEGYNGRMTEQNGGVWTLNAGDSANAIAIDESSKTNERVTLNISRQTDEVVTLSYQSNWRNKTSLKAQDVKIFLLKIIEQLLGADAVTGNAPLFRVFDAMGVEHRETYFFSSLEMLSAVGELNVGRICTEKGIDIATLKSTKSGGYDIMLYLKNISTLGEGCFKGSGLTSIVVPEWITSIAREAFKDCPADLQVVIKGDTVVSDNAFDNPWAIYVPDVAKYKKRLPQNAQHNVEPIEDYGLDCLCFDDGTRIRFNTEQTVLI